MEDRFKTSSQIFDHFFLHRFSNEDRWNFIEDFFLGESKDDLLESYPGGERNHIDIMNYVIEHANTVDTIVSNNTTSDIHIFHPQEGRLYNNDDLLTIEGVTTTVGKWIVKDPMALDKIRREYDLKMPTDAFGTLQSKLRCHHFPYYRDVQGLNLIIEFPGYEKQVKASVPYNQDPIKFYKWWRKNEDKVTLSKADKYKLFLNVENQSSKPVLQKKHKAWLENSKGI